MKKVSLILLFSLFIFTNSCKKDNQYNDDIDSPEQPGNSLPGSDQSSVKYSLRGYPANDMGIIAEMDNDKDLSKLIFWGDFLDDDGNDYSVSGLTYQTPRADSLFNFILDENEKVKQIYISYPNGTRDTSLISFDYLQEDSVLISFYSYDWNKKDARLINSVKMYYKDDKWNGHIAGRFSLSEFKQKAKDLIIAVGTSVLVVEAATAVITLAATATLPAWAPVAAAVGAIALISSSAKASEEIPEVSIPQRLPDNPVKIAEKEIVTPNTSAIDLSGEWLLNITNASCNRSNEDILLNGNVIIKFDTKTNKVWHLEDDTFYNDLMTYSLAGNQLTINLNDEDSDMGCSTPGEKESDDPIYFRYTEKDQGQFTLNYNLSTKSFNGDFVNQILFSPSVPCRAGGASSVSCTAKAKLIKR